MSRDDRVDVAFFAREPAIDDLARVARREHALARAAHEQREHLGREGQVERARVIVDVIVVVGALCARFARAAHVVQDPVGHGLRVVVRGERALEEGGERRVVGEGRGVCR